MEFDMADAVISQDMLSSIPETSLNTPVVTCANGYTKKVDEVTDADTGVVSEVVTCNVKSCPKGPNDETCSGSSKGTCTTEGFRYCARRYSHKLPHFDRSETFTSNNLPKKIYYI